MTDSVAHEHEAWPDCPQGDADCVTAQWRRRERVFLDQIEGFTARPVGLNGWLIVAGLMVIFGAGVLCGFLGAAVLL